jgi:hypothetical protein
MPEVFYRKKFSYYLGEQRAIDDIVLEFIPVPSPTPTPNYCESGITDFTLWFYTDCCGTYVSGTTMGLSICYDNRFAKDGIAGSYGPCSTSCATPTPTPTPSITPSVTPTITPTTTTTSTPTNTPTTTITATPTNTGTPTVTPTNTQTETPTNTPTTTPTNTPTASVTATPTNTGTPTVTPTNTQTSTPTNTPTVTPTTTLTATPTQTVTPTVTPTNTQTSTPTNTPTSSVTATPTQTATPTTTPTNTPTNTNTPSITPTNPICDTLDVTWGGPSAMSGYGGTYILVNGGGPVYLNYNTTGGTFFNITCSTLSGVSYTAWVHTSGYGLIIYSQLNSQWLLTNQLNPRVCGTGQNSLISNDGWYGGFTYNGQQYPPAALGVVGSATISYPDCPGYVTPTPTPSVTATPTTTGTPTVTPTNTQTTTPTVTPTNTGTPTVTPTNTQTSTPTNTPTTTITATPTQTGTPTTTPTNTNTPSVTPTTPPLMAYVFPEPNDSSSQTSLGQYLFDNGSTWYGNVNSGGFPGTTNYANNMNVYAHYPNWSGSSGNFLTNINSLSSVMRLASGVGTDAYGCNQAQYSTGSIAVSGTQVSSGVTYTYSVWIPLNGMGGSYTNSDLFYGQRTSSPPSCALTTTVTPQVLTSAIDVVVTSGGIIPAGTYRVLWGVPSYIQPVLTTYYFRKNNVPPPVSPTPTPTLTQTPTPTTIPLGNRLLAENGNYINTQSNQRLLVEQ